MKKKKSVTWLTWKNLHIEDTLTEKRCLNMAFS